ncbi:MAG: ABC transporter ATP-binding protein [Alphaproteobacteria bacterium]
MSAAGIAADGPVIAARDLGKCFRLFARPGDRVATWLSGGRLGRPREVWALRHVSFAVEKGECLGIIGVNGSGKSTLLKLLTGVLAESEGEVRVSGRLLALLELGTGFNPELTGRQNVVLSTRLLGFPDGYAEARMAEIEGFCGIGAFFDRPMKIYSSGMSTRLAFATFLFLEPEILVVDEALAVGDILFQRKCFAAMAEVLRRGTTVLFVSHDMAAIESLATRVMLLERGEIAFLGEPGEAISRYFARSGTAPAAAALPAAHAPGDLAAEILRHSILLARARAGLPACRIAAARVLDERGRHGMRALVGEELVIQLLLEAAEAVPEPEVELEIFDRFNRLVCGLSLAALGQPLAALAAGERRAVTLRLKAALEPGEYTLTLAAYDRAGAGTRDAWQCHDRHAGLGPLHIAWHRELLPFYGIAALDCTADVAAASGGAQSSA